MGIGSVRSVSFVSTRKKKKGKIKTRTTLPLDQWKGPLGASVFSMQRERERVEEAALLTVKIEEGASGSWERPGNRLSPENSSGRNAGLRHVT